MSEEYDIVRNAILEKKQVFAEYKGFERQMCPHVIGTKNGVEQALFYQFGGQSSSGDIVPDSPQNWRCMAIKELGNVRAYEGEWHTGINHSRQQTCVDNIDVEVDT